MPTEKQRAEADRLVRAFDWSKVDALSDEELRTARDWDKDAVWPTEPELATFDLVISAKSRLTSPKEAAE